MNAQAAQAPPREYGLPNSWDLAARRLAALERTYDPITAARLDRLGDLTGRRCLEVGAGAGSVARDLARRVGSDGSVLAVDIDLSVAGTGSGNLEFRRVDVRGAGLDDGLGDEHFDIVHARMVLSHLPDPVQVLTSLVGRVAPGGWVLLEDVESSQTLQADDERYLAVADPMHQAFVGRGADRWARSIPAALRSAGIVDVAADAVTPVYPGGSMAAEWMELTLRQMHGEGFLPTVDATTLAAAREALRDPRLWFHGVSLVGAWGSRGGTSGPGRSVQGSPAKLRA